MITTQYEQGVPPEPPLDLEWDIRITISDEDNPMFGWQLFSPDGTLFEASKKLYASDYIAFKDAETVLYDHLYAVTGDIRYWRESPVDVPDPEDGKTQTELDWNDMMDAMASDKAKVFYGCWNKHCRHVERPESLYWYNPVEKPGGFYCMECMYYECDGIPDVATPMAQVLNEILSRQLWGDEDDERRDVSESGSNTQ